MEELTRMLDEMSIHMKVNKRQVEKLLKISKHGLEPGLTFIQNLYNNEFQVVKTYWKLLPPETWEMYLTLGITDLREQNLLSGARLTLNAAWKTNYPWKKNVQPETATNVPGGVSHHRSLNGLQDLERSEQSGLLPTPGEGGDCTD